MTDTQTAWEVEKPDWSRDVLGPAELAQELEMKLPTFYVYRSRGMILPPDFDLSMGPVWNRKRVQEWMKAGRPR